MKLAPWFLLVGGLAATFPAPSEACMGHHGRCRGHHRVVAVPACTPIFMIAAPMASSPAGYASPQMVATPVAPTPVATVGAMAPPSVQPAYEYAAATNGQPAYYYTYDNSGKLIIAQWMDWVFRGGRAAGEPAPPLPIIGNLRNR